MKNIIQNLFNHVQFHLINIFCEHSVTQKLICAPISTPFNSLELESEYLNQSGRYIQFTLNNKFLLEGIDLAQAIHTFLFSNKSPKKLVRIISNS